MKLYTHNNQPVTLAAEVGKGGEATIYHVTEYPDLVAKIYHQPTPAHEAKIRAMVINPPEQAKNHITVAWPTALLYQPASLLRTSHENSSALILGNFVGFLMPKVAARRLIFEVYNPQKRAQSFPNFTMFHLVRVAANLATVIQAIHHLGQVIGDVNESNFMVNERALVTVVDTDSFQITTAAHEVYRCAVGKAEYTPPELQGMNFKEVTRQVTHDNFGLAVLIFQLLMQGFHPFAGTLMSEASVGRVDLYAIRHGLFPYAAAQGMMPPRHAPDFAWLHPTLQTMFQRCFVSGYDHPTQRPTAQEWHRALAQVETTLVTCQRDPSHVYFNHLTRCPWCLTQAEKPKVASSIMSNRSQMAMTECPHTLAIYKDNTALTIDVDELGLILKIVVAGLVTMPGIVALYLWMVTGGVHTSFFDMALILGPLFLYLTVCCYIVVRLFNRHYIKLTHQTLKIRGKPLPRMGNKAISTQDILQFYCKRHVTHTQDGASVSFTLYAITAQETIAVFDFTYYDTARFVELQLEEFLNLPDQPIEGEYIPEPQLLSPYRDESQ